MFNKIHEAVDNKLIPGASSALIDNDIVHKDIYGVSSYPDVALEENALYDIASLTKLFVTERILQLLDEKKIELNDPVKKHLPDFSNEDITIKHCLLHRTGFLPSASGRYTMTKEELIESILTAIDHKNEIDKDMVYSCINFILLGFMIEAIDEMGLDESLDKFVIKPLGLSDTSYNPKDKGRCIPTELDTPLGVVHDETARKLDGIAGNAGLFSTLNDIIKFSQYTMKHRTDTLEKYHIDSRSLGWNLHNGVLYHTGFSGPILIIDKDRSLIILTNRIHPSREDTGYLQARLDIMGAFISNKI